MTYTNRLLLFAIGAGMLALGACAGKEPPAAPDNRKPVPVSIVTPGTASHGGVSGSGQIEAAQTANISTRVMGTITRIYVKVGDKVNKGQTLVTINSDDIRAKKAQVDAMITEAEANAGNAKKDFDRFTNLYNKQSASAKELDNVTLQYKSAASKLEAARQMRREVDAMMAYTTIVAPYNGIITQKMTDEGSLASPGMPLLTLEQNNTLQVSATIAEPDINKIKQGDKVQVDIKSIGKTMGGVITQISQSSQTTGGQYVIKCSIPEKDKKGLYAGMYVNVFIPVTPSATAVTEAILVPTSALVHNDQLTGLYTVSSNKTALLRWIRTGKTFGDQTEVLSGLGKDEPFIATADGKLYNGVPVAVKR